MNANNIEQMTAEANALLDNNQADKARELFTRICAQDDSNAEAWLMLGAINGETGITAEATSCVRKAIEIDPDYAEAYYILAQILHSQGDLNGALAAARSATESDPLYADAFMFLSALHGQLGNLQEAETAGRKTLALSPDSADAHIILGNVFRMQGKLPDAEDSFRQALQQNPGLSAAHSGLGGVLVARRQFEEAGSSLQQAIELQPNLADAHNNLGILHLSMQNFDNALNSFNRALSLSPGFALVHANIGNVYMQKGEYDQAIAEYKKAIKLSPQLIEVHLALGNACKAAGDRDAARNSYEAAIGLNPGYLAAPFNLGILEEESGNFEKALVYYDEIIRLDPGNTDAQAAKAGVYEKMGNTEIAYGTIRHLLDSGVQNARLGITYSVLCKHHDNCNDAIRYLENLLTSGDLADDLRADIHFSLGGLLDRAEQFDSAFSHFSQANDLIAVTYRPDEYSHYIDSVIAANSADVLKSLPAPATPSNRPIFIVGMLRSGTTLVEQIISAHPRVFGGGELGGIFKITGNLQSVTGSDKAYPACIADMDQATADAVANEYLESLNSLNNTADHMTDKMPHNFQHLGLIHALFPDAPLIHVIRNPLDTCLSCYFHHFGGYHPYTFKLEHIASHYQQYERLMQHWKDSVKLPVLDVRYEELVADPETVSRQIISHCGLDWDDSCLKFHESGRIAKTASYAQVRQPIYSSALGRWIHYKQHSGPLLEQFREAQ